jgi:hypothetical protein
MKEKEIVSISEITITPILNIGYSYGFTVQYADGEIRNILLQSPEASDIKTKRIIEEKRRKYQQMS